MLIRQVALVSESDNVPFSDLGNVSAALQKQTARDLAPIWEIQATVDAFATLEDVPPGYWPIIIRDDIHVRAAGIHEDGSALRSEVLGQLKKFATQLKANDPQP